MEVNSDLDLRNFSRFNVTVNITPMVEVDYPVYSDDVMSYYEMLLTYLLFSVVFLSGVGTVMNGLIFVAINRNWGVFSARLMLTITLTISDMLVSLSYFLDTIQYFGYIGYIGYKRSLYFRIATESMFCLGKITGLFSVLTLAVDLLLAVYKPVQYRGLMTYRRGVILSLCVWGASIFITALSKILEYLVKFFYVIFQLTIEEVMRASLSIVVLFAIIVIYTIIFNTLRSYHNRHRRRSKRRASNRKAAITLSLIILTYIVLVLPRSFVDLIDNLQFEGKEFLTMELVKVLFHNFLLVNSIIDPVIYSVRLPEVKRIFRP